MINSERFLPYLMILLLSFSLPATAQQIQVGSWREHLPYTRAVSLASTSDRVYCATEQSMFYYDKNEQSIEPVSKNSGLSDVGFIKTAYHAATKTLVIAYRNANIDLIQNGRITNLSDIKRQNLPINKVINDITFKEDEAWLSCGFGIVVLNLRKKEFKQTFLIGENGSYTNINDVKFFDDTVYAATDSGIYRAALTDYLPDFSNWKKWDEIPYPDNRYNTLEFFNSIPYINLRVGESIDDTLFYRENGQWNHYIRFGYERCSQLDRFGNRFVMTKEDNVVVLDESMEVFRHIFDYGIGTGMQIVAAPTEAVIDEQGFLWIADKFKGLVFVYDQWNYILITPNGPATTDAFAMASVDDELWVASGAYNSTWSMTFRKTGLFHYNGLNWKTVNNETDPAMDTIADLVCVAIDPSDPAKVYAGSWDKGLIYLRDGKVTCIYDQTNSTLSVLENNALGVYKVAIGGVTFDSQGNLWVSNAGVTRSLSVLRPDGTWYSFNISSTDMKLNEKVLGKIVIDQIGQKWILIGRGNGIQVFNDNNTLSNPNDDKTAHISGYLGKGNLPSTLVTDMAIDLDGRLWIGSDKGIAIIYSPENVFSGYSYDAQQILVNQDGYDQYLLENETVTAIAVDGANRKWIGTDQSGVFLLSADGTKEIARFHEGNSPLLSNSIQSIVINDHTGEVFFGTNKGIISYRSDATKALEYHNEVKVFPNPVSPDYTGVISITGLVRDADVKITNVSGEVVYSTRSNGGQAVWYGKDFSGRKVASGVYLVFSSEPGGTDTFITKILFIK